MSIRIDRVKLIAEMARQDMTVGTLVEKSGVSRITITSVRSGKSCSEQTARKISEGLGVDVREIMKEEA